MVGRDGEIAGWTGLAEWRAPELAAPKDRDFGLLLGPVVDTELASEFDWEAARRLAELHTRLRPGDLLGRAGAHGSSRRPERPARARDSRPRLAQRPGRLSARPGYPPAMPFYQRLGDVPRKRHIQFRDNGTLLTEEVMGLEGFTGNESILYHLQSPCRVQEIGELRADRARGVGAGDPPAPDDAHEGRRARRRRGHRPPAPDVERGRRDLALPADRADGLLLPERRGRRGDLRPRGLRHAGDDLRRPALQGRRLRRHPARHDLSLPAGG